MNNQFDGFSVTIQNLQNVMGSIDESTADKFMDLALEDVDKLFTNESSKEEFAYRLYRAYILGFSIGKLEK